MCLGLPLKIISINGNDAMGEIDGIERKVRIDLVKDVKIGDFVMVHAGFAIDIVDESTAKETGDAFLEIEKLMENENGKV